MQWHSLSKHYATSRKVTDSNLDEFSGFFFQFTRSPQLLYGPGVNSVSNKDEYHEFSWGEIAQLVYKADNLTAISKPVV
jgi:hypothetical protein